MARPWLILSRRNLILVRRIIAQTRRKSSLQTVRFCSCAFFAVVEGHCDSILYPVVVAKCYTREYFAAIRFSKEPKVIPKESWNDLLPQYTHTYTQVFL